MSLLAAYLSRALTPTSDGGDRTVRIARVDLSGTKGYTLTVTELLDPARYPLLPEDRLTASCATMFEDLDRPAGALDRHLDELDRMIRRTIRPRTGPR